MTVQYTNSDFYGSVWVRHPAPLPRKRSSARKDRRLGLVTALGVSAAGWATIALLLSTMLS